MVDRISGNNNSINDMQLTQLGQSQQVEKAGRETEMTKAGANAFIDSADLSPEAYARLEAEREVSRFATLAFRDEESFDTEKVAFIKSLVDSGQYFSRVSDDDLAESLLNSPIGGALR